MIERVVFHFDNTSAIFAVCGLLLTSVAPHNDWIACINSLHTGHGFVEKTVLCYINLANLPWTSFSYYGFSSENEDNSEMKIFPGENLDANLANLCNYLYFCCFPQAAEKKYWTNNKTVLLV